MRRDPVQPGAYEIIAGHTRWTAAQELELATVPCIVAQLSDADADIMMAETNIQRPDWLPSERAKTYKVWLEAVQTETGITQGQRTDTTSGTECRSWEETEMLPLSVSESAPKRWKCISSSMT